MGIEKDQKKKVTIQEIRDSDDTDNSYFGWRILSKIAPYVSYPFINYTSMTPNQISFIWGIIGLMGISIMSIGGYKFMLLGILIYHFALLIDFVDGAMARIQNRSSLYGVYLEMIAHFLHRGLMLLFLGIGVYRTNGNIWFFYLGIWSSFFLMFHSSNKLELYEMLVNQRKFSLLEKVAKNCSDNDDTSFVEGTFRQRLKSNVIEMFRPTPPLSFVFFSILLGVPHWYLIAMAVLSPLLFIKNFLRMYKDQKNIGK